jgi:hypothetical protein
MKFKQEKGGLSSDEPEAFDELQEKVTSGKSGPLMNTPTSCLL